MKKLIVSLIMTVSTFAIAQTTSDVPMPCQNFCKPIQPPVIENLKLQIILTFKKDIDNKESVRFVIDRLAQEKFTASAIFINVSTDLKMKKKESLRVSQLKADSIKQDLIKKGINADMIKAVGLGYNPDPEQCKPKDNECDLSNRIVDIIIEGTIIKDPNF